eukprot:223780-Chlamydomonas_euryale.AAC.1
MVWIAWGGACDMPTATRVWWVAVARRAAGHICKKRVAHVSKKRGARAGCALGHARSVGHVCKNGGGQTVPLATPSRWVMSAGRGGGQTGCGRMHVALSAHERRRHGVDEGETRVRGGAGRGAPPPI